MYFKDKILMKESNLELLQSRTKDSEADIERKVAQLPSLEGLGSKQNSN
jgi:hypothetical protein